MSMSNYDNPYPKDDSKMSSKLVPNVNQWLSNVIFVQYLISLPMET